MKVLAIVGSYRKGGNTDLITDRILAGAAAQGASTEKIFVDDLKLGSCQGCMECRPEGICRQKDDLADLVKKIEAADGIIFGSPIYGNYLTGQAKILLDRLMGVISKTVFVPGEGPKRVSRLELKLRQICLLMTAGADREECAADPLKLLRRMFASMTNGGFIEEFIATDLMDFGQVVMDVPALEAIVRRQHRPDPTKFAEGLFQHNRQILDRAFALGKRMTAG